MLCYSGAGRKRVMAHTITVWLIYIGWILNGLDLVWCAPPVAVIDRDDIKESEINSKPASGHVKDILINDIGRDMLKTETTSHRTDLDGDGPPVIHLPEFVITELNLEGNRTQSNLRNGTVVVTLEYQPGLVIRCAGMGSPRPNATWEYVGGDSLPQYVEMTGLTHSSNQTNGQPEDLAWVDLTLPKLNNAFYGKLLCRVENIYGNATWEMDLVPNANSSIFMKLVRCTFAGVFILVSVLLIKTLLWMDFKRKEMRYEKLPAQDLEIINKFRKGLPPPPPSPSSSIVPSGTNCVSTAIEITVTGDGGTSPSDPPKLGYRLVKHGSSSPDLEKRFLRVGSRGSGGGGASTPSSCSSVHVLDSVNTWTNYAPYDDKLETSSQHFKVDYEQILENGVYGMVFRGKVRNDLSMQWSTVAVKSGKTERDDNFLLESILTELKILASLPKAHEHIVNLRGAYTKMLHKRQALVFVDFCENGTLADFIDLNRSGFLDIIPSTFSSASKIGTQRMDCSGGSDEGISIPKDEGLVMSPTSSTPSALKDNDKATPLQFSTKELITWAWQIADGMNFLHKHRVVHGNLSCANVYVTSGLKVKIGNIGYPPAEQSMECIDETTKKWLTVPDYCYEQFSKKSDVYDYGRTLWDIFSLRGQSCPDVKEVHDFLKGGDREIEVPDYASSEIFEILLCCWNDDDTLRPEFDFFVKVFKHLLKAMFPPTPKASTSTNGGVPTAI